MPTILVTGGCGFIGSHLCARLTEQGHAVRVLDDLSTGRRDNLPAGASLLEGDVADPALVARAVAGVDGVVHLAAIASVERCVRDWVGSHRVNLTGTITLLDALRARPVPFVYASSAAVYGDAPTLPVTETTPARPLAAYGADKLGSELHAAVASHSFAIPTTGLRFFNVHGPRQDPASPYSGVISIFCRRALAGEALTVFGDGGQTRDFVSVEDVTGALVAALGHEAPVARVFNVCTGVGTSVRDLAALIGEAAGRAPEIIHAPPRTGEIRHSLGDPAAARAAGLLGPAPRALADALPAVIAWMRES